jgi:hypothetical protein
LNVAGIDPVALGAALGRIEQKLDQLLVRQAQTVPDDDEDEDEEDEDESPKEDVAKLLGLSPEDLLSLEGNVKGWLSNGGGQKIRDALLGAVAKAKAG